MYVSGGQQLFILTVWDSGKVLVPRGISQSRRVTSAGRPVPFQKLISLIVRGHGRHPASLFSLLISLRHDPTTVEDGHRPRTQALSIMVSNISFLHCVFFSFCRIVLFPWVKKRSISQILTLLIVICNVYVVKSLRYVTQRIMGMQVCALFVFRQD